MKEYIKVWNANEIVRTCIYGLDDELKLYDLDDELKQKFLRRTQKLLRCQQFIQLDDHTEALRLQAQEIAQRLIDAIEEPDGIPHFNSTKVNEIITKLGADR